MLSGLWALQFIDPSLDFSAIRSTGLKTKVGFEISDGVKLETLHTKEEPSMDVSVGVPGIELYRLGVIGDGLVEVPLNVISVGIGVGSVVVSNGVLGVELNRFGVIGDGLVEVPPISIEGASVLVSTGELGVELYRRGVIGDGL